MMSRLYSRLQLELRVGLAVASGPTVAMAPVALVNNSRDSSRHSLSTEAICLNSTIQKCLSFLLDVVNLL